MELRITDLLDDYRDDFAPVSLLPVPDNSVIKEVCMKRIRKKSIRPLRIAVVAAIIVILLAGTVLGISYAKSTILLEDAWNRQAEESFTQEQKDYVEVRSADIGESVTDKGVTITLESVTCTTDVVYLLFRYEFDPGMFDLNNINTCTDAFTSVRVENGEYSSERFDSSGSSEKQADAVLVKREYYFEDIPENANLGDGETIMYIEIPTVWVGYEEEVIPDVEGSWNFGFTLPEAESSPEVTADTKITFDCGTELNVSDISVNESGCSFVASADNYDYFFCDSMNAELVRAAEPVLLQITVEAKLEDGTVIPSSGANAGYDEELDAEVWKIMWSAPVDPSTVISLVFSDGIMEYLIDLQ